MFYMSYKDIWRWKMNVARVMGNSRDASYIPDLIRAFNENADERVKAMAAWAIGHIGGQDARSSLEIFQNKASGLVREEVQMAMDNATTNQKQEKL